MDEIYAALCQKLSEGQVGKYAIYYEDELLEVFPEDERSRDALEAALTRLTKEGCIEVRYARGPAFCLAYLKPFTPETRAALGGTTSAEQPRRANGAALAVAMLAAAFFGGALGGGLSVFLGGLL